MIETENNINVYIYEKDDIVEIYSKNQFEIYINNNLKYKTKYFNSNYLLNLNNKYILELKQFKVKN
jgi:hypothetical protein